MLFCGIQWTLFNICNLKYISDLIESRIYKELLQLNKIVFVDNNVECLLYMLNGHLYIFSTEMSIQILCYLLIGLFVFLLLGCKNYLCNLYTSHLLYIWFAKTFFPILWVAFLLSYCSIAFQGQLLKMYPIFLLFSFVSCAFGVKYYLTNCIQSKVTIIYSYVFFYCMFIRNYFPKWCTTFMLIFKCIVNFLLMT